ncbi:cupin domain-containing carboxymuconolactone decarboxylase family protein [Trueperella sp. LYQ141]|uniref:cupin domain-containing carboxymuconolactone decarboxylase family protein n=1 Tax=Trueperella sp. LYQ141 TaxID=3391058 RepID=UPI00398334A9
MSTSSADWQPVDPRFFTGNARLRMDTVAPEIAVAAVQFDPGCRNYWHSHPVSQTLIVTDGLGIYQEVGQPAIVLRPGMTLYIGPDVLHWHGATPNCAMTHTAITLNDPERGNAIWAQEVDEETYLRAYDQLQLDEQCTPSDPAGERDATLSPSSGNTNENPSPNHPITTHRPVTAGRDQLGTFAPMFAELNDDVLFGQVWARTDELSARDRSLITITTLMASGITDSSLRFHLDTARNNGITKAEIAEIITHAAFYMGWPKAWAVFNLAKDVWV